MMPLISERSPNAPSYAPPRPGDRGESSRAESDGGQNIARRFVARFGLIAFGLYHIPLFLNNYPSLGGGGFNDDGLAPRWGHVFTPAGVWVAQHLFHMTGPMLQGHQGDNGDVGEEFGRLLLCVVIGLAGAAWWTIVDRRRPRARWVDDALRVLLRYSIALGLASYAISKLVPQQFPPLTTAAMEDRLGDLTPMALLWRFMEYSRPYAFFGGAMELAAVLLLCYRRTATLGALVCIAVMTNVAALNYFYGVPVKLYATMLVVSAAALALYDWRRLVAVFVTNRDAPPAPMSSALSDRFSPRLRWTLKAALVGSVMLSSIVAMAPTLSPKAESGLDGSWIVTSFAQNGKALDSSADPARWRHMLADPYSMSLRTEGDVLVRCRRTASVSNASAISLVCSRNHRGELTWTREANTLHVAGTFDGSIVSATAQRVDSSSYSLFRSRFRLITDR